MRHPQDPNHQVLYLSHGAGPMPLLGDPGHREMVDNLQQIASKIGKPAAILVISAHWEEMEPAVTSGASPSLIYDYGGFPPESYEITYPASGEPQLADQVVNLLKKHGIDARKDEGRGFDHGLFVPLKIMYPDADIPCIQLSLMKNLNAATHIKIGEALSKLTCENLLIIGSGFSFHNMKAFFQGENSEAERENKAFEAWLVETCTSRELSEEERSERLATWKSAPGALYCHPREEHLLPLHVCYGVAKRPCLESFQLTIIGKKASVYLW